MWAFDQNDAAFWRSPAASAQLHGLVECELVAAAFALDRVHTRPPEPANGLIAGYGGRWPIETTRHVAISLTGCERDCNGNLAIRENLLA